MPPLSLDHFRLLAPFYDRIFGGLDPRRLRELMAPFPAQEGLLLDLGGGTGRVVQMLGCRLERVVVADISQAMLRQARAKSFPCVLAAAEALPFRASAFGRVVMVDAFHHLADQEIALQEAWRVLRAGGRLVVEEPDIQHWAVRGIALGERLLLMRSHFRPAEWLAERLTALGGTVQVVRERANYWVVAHKAPRKPPDEIGAQERARGEAPQ